MKIGLTLALFLVAVPASASERGIASRYGLESGSKTASGERLSVTALTAAHKTLPIGTVVRVTNMTNGRSVDVRINDRGPFVKGRVIDLAPASAKAVGLYGLAVVTVEVVEMPPVRRRR